jgi:hypothetical protein
VRWSRAPIEAVYIVLPCRDAWPSNTSSLSLAVLYRACSPSSQVAQLPLRYYNILRTSTGRASFTATTSVLRHTSPSIPSSSACRHRRRHTARPTLLHGIEQIWFPQLVSCSAAAPHQTRPYDTKVATCCDRAKQPDSPPIARCLAHR